MEIEGNVVSLLLETGGLLRGHFLLSSGLHSPQYLQCALLLQHPKRASHLGKELAKKFNQEKIEIVIGPALGGIIIAYEVARVLGTRALFAERVEEKMQLRRGFKINSGEKVLVVEDVITTGGSAKEVIELVNELGGVVVGVGALIDRSQGKVNFGVPLKTLANLNIETYSREACPLCKEGLPLVKPGSKIK
ncbi:MAG: orotate phosphoribosyltransferase [bacterium]|nr:orotate phosphoribosyltransferase [bacterium]